MKILGIIPARYASSRFPGKPLIDIDGKSMIQRVYEQSRKCSAFSDVIVATDDERIFRHVQSFGGKAMMTSTGHLSGTDRCAEVLENRKESTDVVFNIQGDEPFIHPEQLGILAECFQDKNTEIATLAKKISDTETLFNSNVPKVIFNSKQEAIYFSRAAIPYFRGVPDKEWVNHHPYYKHIGIYSYRTEILRKISVLPPSPLESVESLEQLRWLENGFKIRIEKSDYESISIDAPEDLKKITPEMLK